MYKPTLEIPAEVTANLITEEGKEGDHYVIAHQGDDTMTVIVKDNKLMQIPISAEIKAQTSTPHPVGTKVWWKADGSLDKALEPTYAVPKASKSQGSTAPRQQA